jgi:5-methyltetrahydrofolate--homocysteine methyltransferase
MEFGRGDDVREINRQGVRLARKAAGSNVLVAGDVGPTGTVIEPVGESLFDEVVHMYLEQIRSLVEEGVDLIAIETMFDLMEIRAAVMAANEVRRGIPLLATMTYNKLGMTETGAGPEASALVLEGLGVDVIGLNCSTGPEPMVDLVRRLARQTDTPISVKPNAGIPYREGDRTRYPLSPEETAAFAGRFVEAGANLVGGCCGTTPETIRRIASRIRGASPRTKGAKKEFGICGRSMVIRCGPGHPFVPIGERINPSRKRALADSIRERKTDLIVSEARRQGEEGAMALDVNVGVPLTDEAEMMGKAVAAIQNTVELPLSLDSSFAGAIHAGLRNYSGKALVNSVDGHPEKQEEILPLVKRFGTAVIVLPMGDRVPETAQERLRALEEILKRVEDAGIPRTHVIVDCLALVVSAMPEASRQTLETISRVKSDFGLPTLLGLSNVSFGLPQRKWVHHAFLSMAIGRGLDAALLNPGGREVHQVIAGSSLFAGRDPGCQRYLSFAGREGSGGESPTLFDRKPEAVRDRLFTAVVEGMADRIRTLVETALQEGMTASEIFFDVLTPAIRHLGDLFGRGIKFIPQLMASAETMKGAMEVLNPLLKRESPSTEKGTVIFAPVKGDIHDFGKNICALMLENAGFRVIDLGRNVSREEILRAASEHPKSVVALSALMTTTMLEMKSVIDTIRDRNLNVKVVVGGAPVTAEFAKAIGADGYGDEAGEAASVMELVMRGIVKPGGPIA